MNPTLQLLLQLLFVILAAISAAFSGLMFFTLRDLRDRIMRLENRAMGPVTGSTQAYRHQPLIGTAGQG